MGATFANKVAPRRVGAMSPLGAAGSMTTGLATACCASGARGCRAA